MTPAEIKFELSKRGITQAGLARALGVSVTTVNSVVQNRMVSDRIMEAVAKAIGKRKEDIFPVHCKKPTMSIADLRAKITA